MKRKTLWALLLLTSPLAAWAAPKAALVIGNSAYAVGDRLANPVNDATDVAARLRKLGYETILLKDANYDTMLDGLRRLRQLLEPQGVAVFYFAGHGMQVEGQNYLIPVDARMDDRDRVDRDGFKLSNISRSLLEGGTRENLMIIDACRNDPFPRKFRSGERGLARVDSGTRVAGGGADLMMLFAASPGEVAQDGSGRNGLFTGQLLQHLETPGQSISQLFQQVKKGVLSASSGKQMIYMEGDPLADFYFVPGRAPDAPPPPSPLDPEVVFWNSIQGSTEAGDFEEYLKQYPAGRFAGLARSRKAKFEVRAHVSAEKPVVNMPAVATAAANQTPAVALAKARQPAANPVRADQELLFKSVPAGGPKLGSIFRDCQGICPELVVLPPGSFRMGATRQEHPFTAGEAGQHTVSLDYAFAIGVHKVTTKAYGQYLHETGRAEPATCHQYESGQWVSRPYKDSGRPLAARLCLAWNDATAYVAWLSLKTGQRYRLPSESEWEYFARLVNGGVIRDTTGIKTFSANSYGREWVEDCFEDSYENAPLDGAPRTQCSGAASKVMRGGESDDPVAQTYVYPYRRYFREPYERYGNVGLRVVREL